MAEAQPVQAHRRYVRQRFMRRRAYVAVTPVRFGAVRVLPGTVFLEHCLREFHARSLYARQQIALEGDPWAAKVIGGYAEKGGVVSTMRLRDLRELDALAREVAEMEAAAPPDVVSEVVADPPPAPPEPEATAPAGDAEVPAPDGSEGYAPLGDDEPAAEAPTEPVAEAPAPKKRKR